MGLSERKVKQRIGADPRNLAWAENAAKFGHTYLAKHGWTPSTGLGVAGDGRVSHIAVAQKLDQLGIGAGRPDGPDAIAWKQAKEFEGLLERLNAAGAGAGEETVTITEEIVQEEIVDEKEEKARRKEKRREEKRKAKAALEESGMSGSSTGSSTEEVAAVVAAPAPRRLAHRARFLAAKRMAGTSSTALSEILGVSSSTTPSSTSIPSTPLPNPDAQAALTAIPVLDDANQITTSTQSVADYFRDKMRARAQANAGTSAVSVPVVTFEEPEEESAPRGGLGSRPRDDEDEPARASGLGFASAGVGLGLGFKRASTPPASSEESSTAPTTESHTPTPAPAESSKPKREKRKDDDGSRKEKKRKRKEELPPTAPASIAAVDEGIPSIDQEPTATVPTSAHAEDEVEIAADTAIATADSKAAKRARKEAKRAAKAKAKEEQNAGETEAVDNGDRPKKKKRQAEVA